MSNQIDRVFVNGKWYVSDSARQFAQAQAVREAIAAERARWSAFADENGEPRKVLGTLPVTADGCVAMPGTEVFHPDQDRSFHLEVMRLLPDTVADTEFPLPDDCEYMGHYSYWEGDTGYSQYESYDVRHCYSTREAAESARAEAGKEKPNA